MRKNFLLLIFCFVIVFLVISPISFSVNAIDNISNQEEQQAKSGLDLKVLDKKYDGYKDDFILNFDVSDSGKIAVLFDNATIVILDSKGDFQVAFSFNKNLLNTRKLSVNISWKEENIEIIFGSGDAYIFNSNGVLLDVNKSEISESNIGKSDVVRYGNYVYEMKNSNILVELFSGGRHKLLVRTEKNGEQEILFNSLSYFPINTVVFIVILVSLVSVWIFIMVVLIRSQLKHG